MFCVYGKLLKKVGSFVSYFLLGLAIKGLKLIFHEMYLLAAISGKNALIDNKYLSGQVSNQNISDIFQEKYNWKVLDFFIIIII